MIILGLDPGLARTGFGAIDTNQTKPFLRCGCITTPAHQEMADRLTSTAADVVTLITEIKPDLIAIEEVFFGRNTTTALQTAHVRGALMLVARQHHVPIRSVTPLQVKSQLTGYGRASKVQVQKIVQERLHLSHPPQPDDAADAVAVALYVADRQHTDALPAP